MNRRRGLSVLTINKDLALSMIINLYNPNIQDLSKEKNVLSSKLLYQKTLVGKKTKRGSGLLIIQRVRRYEETAYGKKKVAVSTQNSLIKELSSHNRRCKINKTHFYPTNVIVRPVSHQT